MRSTILVVMALGMLAGLSLAGEPLNEVSFGYAGTSSADQWLGFHMQNVKSDMLGTVFSVRRADKDDWSVLAGLSMRVMEHPPLFRDLAIYAMGGSGIIDEDSEIVWQAGLSFRAWRLRLHTGYDFNPSGVAFGLSFVVLR